MNSESLEAAPILKYLNLPETYQPQPSEHPIEFLRKHLRDLPPQLLQHFSASATPKERTVLPIIRNRRLRYTTFRPSELSFDVAKDKWPTLWPGRERPGQNERIEEKKWADREFLGGQKQHVGKLGSMLGDYAEEREADRIRMLKRQAAEDAFTPEEEDDDSEDIDEEDPVDLSEDTFDEMKRTFERAIQERFIYGTLDVSTVFNEFNSHINSFVVNRLRSN